MNPETLSHGSIPAGPITASSDGRRTFHLPLAEVRHDTPSVCTYRFHLGDVDFPYNSGQHVTVAVEDRDGNRIEEMLSLSSSPTEQGFVAATTNHGDTEFKRLLARETGFKVELTAPEGDFHLELDRPAVMIAAGAGVTPFRAMLREAADRGSEQSLRLVYAAPSEEEIAFRHDLELICRELDDCQTFLTTAAPQSGARFCGDVGRVDLDLVTRATAGLERPVYYVSGPAPVVRDIERCLVLALGVDPADIRTEPVPGYH